MGFGSSMKDAPPKTAPVEDGEQSAQTFEQPWLDTKNGRRTLRILPALVHDGGAVLDEPEKEVRWVEYWWLMQTGKPVRIILDWRNPFDNPLWRFVSNKYEKGQDERKLKQRFGVNVYDKTPVLFGPNKEVVYPNEDDVYILRKDKNDAGQILQGEPTPHNVIRILEGSAGDKGGKHLLALVSNYDGTEDGDGKPRQLHEFDLRIKTTGTYDKVKGGNFARIPQTTANFKPLSEEIVHMPRWNISEWAQPWPNECIQRIMDGEDLTTLIEEYDIVLYPRKTVSEATQESLFD